MPRGRLSTSKSSTTPLKRALSPSTKTNTPPSRQSKRLKSSPPPSSSAKTKVTPKKSQFFSHSATTSEPESEIQHEESGYEDEDASVSEVSSPPDSEDDEEEEEYVSSEEEQRKPKRKVKGGSGKKGGATNGVAETAKAIVQKGKELWRQGVKSDLAPGEEVFVKLPKARGDGGVKYKEGVIHPNTLLFLGDLKKNNDREWLKGRPYRIFSVNWLADNVDSVHDADYRQSKKDWDAFVEKMTERIVEIDETIPELPPKDLTFRICRHLVFHLFKLLLLTARLIATFDFLRIPPHTRPISPPHGLAQVEKAHMPGTTSKSSQAVPSLAEVFGVLKQRPSQHFVRKSIKSRTT
ncbi:MAG: hypothetical protein Q9183_005963 [Haloplaca sp. 2 TL-2023]